MDPLLDLRKSAYKARSHFKPEEVRRRRETTQVEIRKQKREQNLAKRRNLRAPVSAATSDDTDDEVEAPVYDERVGLINKLAIYVSHIDICVYS